MAVFLILGAGFTGARVARRLAARGAEVWATSRRALELEGVRCEQLDLDDPGSLGRLAAALPGRLRVLHSIPLLPGLTEPTAALLAALSPKLERLVYLSTTSVYGSARVVDETTAAAPESHAARLRVEAENQVLNGPWSGLVLRASAIYGPGRGAQVSIPRGDFKLLGDGSNFVSRIHVDDLARLAEAALLSDIGGAWPVADREPVRSREIAEYVCRLLGCPMPAPAPAWALHETRRADRRVDARAVFERLGVELRYPSYREGIAASLAAESFSF